MKKIKLRDFWWEDDTLCVEDEAGNISRFANAKVVNVSVDEESTESMTVTLIPVVVVPNPEAKR